MEEAWLDLQPGLLDTEVVRAHTVPGRLLFSRPRRPRPAPAAPTAQYRPGSPVLSVVARLVGPDAVQAVTLVGSASQPRGTVTATILAGDIALGNGVLHLIDRPLVVQTPRLSALLAEDTADPALAAFSRELARYPDLATRLSGSAQATVLLPSSEALALASPLSHRQVSLHLLSDALQPALSAPTTLQSFLSSRLAGGVRVWLEGESLHCRAGGSVARLSSPTTASNGFIYPVDSVLGRPQLSVLGYLASDPEMRYSDSLCHAMQYLKVVNSHSQDFFIHFRLIKKK